MSLIDTCATIAMMSLAAANAEDAVEGQRRKAPGRCGWLVTQAVEQMVLALVACHPGLSMNG